MFFQLLYILSKNLSQVSIMSKLSILTSCARKRIIIHFFAGLTKVGKFVKSTSIDELPQLINVLKGDMALIGPRPLLPQYLPLYSPEQARRHEVRPGISGWAQCHGRNAISWTEKFKLDVWYVDHVSMMTDLKVIWITIMKVLKRDGISQEGNATMEAFNGKN